MVFNLDLTVQEFVSLKHDVPCPRADADGRSAVGFIRVLKAAADDGNVLGFTLNIDAEPGFRPAIVADDTILNPVSVSMAEFVYLLAEDDTTLAVFSDSAVADNVIGVAMPEVDAVLFVLGKGAVFRDPIANTPTPVKACSIAGGRAVAKDRPLGATAGMEAAISVVPECTAVEADVVAHLEAAAIAVELLYGDVLEGPPVTVLHEDPGDKIAVDVFTRGAVAVEHDVFHTHVVHIEPVDD